MSTQRNCTYLALLAASTLSWLVILAGCGTSVVPPLGPGGPGGPGGQPNTPGNTSPFQKGDIVFSLKTTPMEGFTSLNSGATLEHWVFRPPLTQGRAFCGAAALNDRIYAIGGNTATLTELDTAEMLDLPGTGVWTPIAKLSAPRTGVAAAAANGKIYAIGGFRTGVPLVGTNEEYDPTTNTWTLRAPNPTPRSYAAAVAVNGKIYLMGGSTIVNNVFTDTTSVDEYDPVTNAWTPKAPMPVAMSTHAAAELNGKIHVVIGTTHLEYDPATNGWTPRKPMTKARDRLGAFSFNGKLFAVGGRFGGAVSGDVEEYSPEFDGWTPRLSIGGTNLRESCGHASIGPSLYRIGGTAPTGQGGNNHNIQVLEYFAHTPVFPFRKE